MASFSDLDDWGTLPSLEDVMQDPSVETGDPAPPNYDPAVHDQPPPDQVGPFLPPAAASAAPAATPFGIPMPVLLVGGGLILWLLLKKG